MVARNHGGLCKMKPVLFLAPILILFVDAGKLCLPDAVPEEQRVYLQTDAWLQGSFASAM